MTSRQAYRVNLQGAAKTPMQLFFVISETFTIVDCHQGVESLFQITRDHALGKPIDQIFTWVDPIPLKTNMEKSLARHEIVAFEAEYHTPGQATGRLACTCTPFWISTDRKLVMVSAEDITEKRQMERQFLLKEKMTSLSKLAANIAHEINNPLEAILNRIGCILMEDFKDIKISRVKKELELIQEQVYQISATTNALIAFCKDSKENFLRQDISSIVAKALELCRIYRDTSNVDFDAFYEANLPPVMGNEVSLEQCFVNILNNAVDATQGSGKILIKTRSVIEDNKTHIQVTIKDNGCGMDNETLQNIFDPFFTTKKQGRGSGLGLAIVYGIVADHQGLIRVTSQVDKGSEFSITLPAITN